MPSAEFVPDCFGPALKKLVRLASAKADRGGRHAIDYGNLSKLLQSCGTFAEEKTL